jgi:hypothetical protein
MTLSIKDLIKWRRNSMRASTRFVTAMAFLVLPGLAMAHGYAGKRFFPAAMAVDDPFVADEAGIRLSRGKDESNTATTDLAFDYAKTITPSFALSIGGDYLKVKPQDDVAQYGLANTVIGAKYLLFKNDAREMLLSVGANLELGGTGASRVGAESRSTLSPAIFFGKGFGDLSESARYLRPLAVTVSVAAGFSTHSFNARSMETGFTVSYDLGYLQNYVKDVGLGKPFNRMIPIVEVPLSTCTTGDCSGRTTGTVNPGVIWYGRNYQFGLEAAIPVNHASGSHTGVIAQIHFYIDDLFPNSLGRPIFK